MEIKVELDEIASKLAAITDDLGALAWRVRAEAPFSVPAGGWTREKPTEAGNYAYQKSGDGIKVYHIYPDEPGSVYPIGQENGFSIKLFVGGWWLKLPPLPGEDQDAH